MSHRSKRRTTDKVLEAASILMIVGVCAILVADKLGWIKPTVEPIAHERAP